MPSKVCYETTYPLQASTVQPLKFENGKVISSHTVQWIWLLILTGYKVPWNDGEYREDMTFLVYMSYLQIETCIKWPKSAEDIITLMLEFTDTTTKTQFKPKFNKPMIASEQINFSDCWIKIPIVLLCKYLTLEVPRSWDLVSHFKWRRLIIKALFGLICSWNKCEV